ncbi:MAG: PAS domain S-box protein [Planctomycetes bacterium]|nr:PAS domain S-box protein [Planctomycetota bacterium]
MAAGTVAFVGALKLVGYGFGWRVGLDRLLFAQRLGDNEMAPNTAAYFLLTGLALALLDVRTRRGLPPSQGLTLLTAVGSFLSLLGYVYGADSLYIVGPFIPMAVNTAMLFQLLSLGILAARPGRGATRVITDPGIGGLSARRLLLAALVVPVVCGWLRLLGERGGLYGGEFGVALMVASTTMIFAAIAWWTGAALARVDDQRRQSVEALQRTAAEIHGLYENAERQVAQRTVELTEANQALQTQIDEHRRAQLDLRQSEERFRLLVESIEDYALLMLDPEGHIASWNSGAERIKGYREEEILGRHFSCFYPREDIEDAKPERMLEAAAAEGRVEDEGWRIRRDGAPFWASVVIHAIRDDEGRLIGFSKVTRDITERRRAGEQIDELNAQLRQRLRELAAINRDLEHKNQENEMFVYSVSHDLRSPLVNLQGFSNELREVCSDIRSVIADHSLPEDVQRRALDLIDKDAAESLHFIQSAVTRLSSIIDALLRLSRAGRIEYQFREVDLSAVVARVADAMKSTIDEKEAVVSVGELPPVWGDATAVEQVFANLIGNALKYLDPGRPGQIEIGWRGESSGDPAHHTFYVRDNGLGIPEHQQSKAFQAFQRLHPHMAGGEGMGLTIVRRIVERHGGQIWIEPEETPGTTFHLTFPAPPHQCGDALGERAYSNTERSEERARAISGDCVSGR